MAITEEMTISGKNIGEEKPTEISRDMTIGEAVSLHPSVAHILTSYGLHCIGCSVNKFETIEEGAKGHGMSGDVINNMIKDVNKVIKSASSFSITDFAAEKIKALVKGNYKFLRVGVVPGGCSGYKYEFKRENMHHEGDTIIRNNGANVILDRESLKLLSGSEVDYVEDLQGAGFKINNPNAKETCGCGKSFH